MPYLKWRRPDLKVKTSGKSSIFRLKIHICKLKMHICNLKIYICRLKIELSSEVSNFSSDVNRFPLGIKKRDTKECDQSHITFVSLYIKFMYRYFTAMRTIKWSFGICSPAWTFTCSTIPETGATTRFNIFIA